MARLELEHLVKQYGAAYAVHDLSLEVADSELICFLGPSGCGKTTTLRMIGGFITPDGGDIRIDGVSVLKQPPERRPTGMVFQRYTLWPHMDIWHNVAFGLQLRHKPRKEVDRAVREALDLVGLPGIEKRNPAQLSGGQQQRIALARALVLEPRILLLDEPLSNLDAQLRVRMREEVSAIQRRVGITTVFVTHDQEEALSIADRIAVMHDGVLEQVATPADLYARPATRFVATFIGTMNLLDGRVEERDRAVAGPFTLALPPGHGLSDGARIVAGVRPDEFILRSGAGEAGDRTAVCARVTQITDLGHYYRVVVEAPETERITVFVTKQHDVTIGPCTITPQRVLWYVDDRLVGITEQSMLPGYVGAAQKT